MTRRRGRTTTPRDGGILSVKRGSRVVRRRMVAFACCCALLAAGPACSFVFVRGPPQEAPAEREPARTPECTGSVAAPVADAVIGIAALAIATVGLSYGLSGCKPGFMGCFDRDVGNVVALTAGVPSLVFLASALYGHVKTSDCREAKRCASSPGSCAPLPTPPVHACSNDRDCPAGRVCLDGYCRRDRRAGPPD